MADDNYDFLKSLTPNPNEQFLKEVATQPAPQTEKWFQHLAPQMGAQTGDEEMQGQIKQASEAQPENVRAGYEQELGDRLRGHLLQKHVENESNYLKSGILGRRSTLGDFFKRMPDLGGYSLGEAVQLNQAANAFEEKRATPEQYQALAAKIAREKYDAEDAGWKQKAADMALGAPAFVAEWAAMGGPAEALGMKAASKVGESAFLKFMAKYGAAAALRTATTGAPHVAGEALQDMEKRVSLDKQGRPELTPGEEATTAIGKSAVSNYLSNFAFESLGLFKTETAPGFGGFLKSTALGTARGFAAAQGAREASHYLVGTAPGTISAAPRMPRRRRKGPRYSGTPGSSWLSSAVWKA